MFNVTKPLPSSSQQLVHILDIDTMLLHKLDIMLNRVMLTRRGYEFLKNRAQRICYAKINVRFVETESEIIRNRRCNIRLKLETRRYSEENRCKGIIPQWTRHIRPILLSIANIYTKRLCRASLRELRTSIKASRRCNKPPAVGANWETGDKRLVD